MLYCQRMVLRLILSELAGGFLALPVWWYGRGLAMMAAWLRRSVREASELFALGVWVRNVFVPMYGETEWSGRLISFLIRVTMIAARGTAVAVWTAVAAAGFAAYLAVLPAAVLGLLYHGAGWLFS